MAEELDPDLCVIGGGPGGIAAALGAAAAGLTVLLVEKGPLGGRNLVSGTVPARALGAAADTYEALRLAPGFGISAGPLQVNLGKVREHMAAAADAAGRSVTAARLVAQSIRVISASARFTSPRTLEAGGAIVRPRHVILAVGSVPAIPDLPGLADAEYATSLAELDFAKKPTHLIVLGAGGHALALAQACVRLGIDTTVVDEGSALPGEDPELAAIVLERLKVDGVRFRTATRISSVAKRRGGVRLVVADPAEGEVAVDGSHILIAAGRSPDVEDLGLAAAGIGHTPAGIAVNRRLRTANRRVFAIGDAIAGPALAGRAAQEAAAVVRAILYRLPVGHDPLRVPTVVFTDPQLASVGFAETEARRRHGGVQVLRFPFAGNDLAVAERLPMGAIKVVAGRNGRILGVSIAGRNAGELIAPWSLAMANGLPVTAFRDLPLPYPTRSFIAREAVAAFTPSGLTHLLRRRIIAFLRQIGQVR